MIGFSRGGKCNLEPIETKHVACLLCVATTALTLATERNTRRLARHACNARSSFLRVTSRGRMSEEGECKVVIAPRGQRRSSRGAQHLSTSATEVVGTLTLCPPYKLG